MMRAALEVAGNQKYRGIWGVPSFSFHKIDLALLANIRGEYSRGIFANIRGEYSGEYSGRIYGGIFAGKYSGHREAPGEKTASQPGTSTGVSLCGREVQAILVHVLVLLS